MHHHTLERQFSCANLACHFVVPVQDAAYCNNPEQDKKSLLQCCNEPVLKSPRKSVSKNREVYTPETSSKKGTLFI